MNSNNCKVFEVVTQPMLHDKTWTVMVDYIREDGSSGLAPLVFDVLEDAENVGPGYEFYFEGYDYV